MKCLVLLSLVFLAACQTAMTPGSVYRATGRISELLAEPTYDVGGDPSATYFYRFQVPHYDADGHGLYDIPVVAGEQLFFAPTWLFSGAMWATGAESYLSGPRLPGSNAGEKALGAARGTGAYALAVPGTMLYLTGFLTTMTFDTALHDVPVIVIGRPLKWLKNAAVKYY